MLDLVADLISHRQEIVTSGTSLDIGTNRELGTLQSRAEREEALRRQDLEHKRSALAPRTHSDKPKYPHVYGRDQGTGSLLTWAGRKFALPHGSSKTDNEVSESIHYLI
jgi:antiviral helicase SLH1